MNFPIGLVTAGFVAALVVHAPQLPDSVTGTVAATSGRVRGTVVYLVHTTPVNDLPPRDSALIDQVNLRFIPQVLPVTPGTTVEFRNSDPILHNVFGPGTDDRFDLGRYPRTERRAHTFSQLGAHVILCHVHPEMVAYVVVIPTAYHGLVDEDGGFRIDGVAPGRYILRTWHPFLEAGEQEVTVPTAATIRVQLRSGRGS